MADAPHQAKPRRRKPYSAIVVVGVALASTLALVTVLQMWLPLGQAHDLAETIGGVGSLVAVALVAWTLHLQSLELREQRNEQRRMRRAIQRQGRLLERQASKDRPKLKLRSWTGRDSPVEKTSLFNLVLHVTNTGTAPVREVIVYLYDRGTGAIVEQADIGDIAPGDSQQRTIQGGSREEDVDALLERLASENRVFAVGCRDSLEGRSMWRVWPQQAKHRVLEWSTRSNPSEIPFGDFRE